MTSLSDIVLWRLTAGGLAEAGFLLGFLLAYHKPGGTALSKVEWWLAGILGSLMAISVCGTLIEQIGLKLHVAGPLVVALILGWSAEHVIRSAEEAVRKLLRRR